MSAQKYYGNYLGIVVQNNDPLKRGRVKVFVPHITPTAYSNWVSSLSASDKSFKFVGRNIDSSLSTITDELKKILPWADIAAPLVGESSSGRFNQQYDSGTISDSSNIRSTLYTAQSSVTSKLTKYSQNIDNIGEKPGNVFDIDYYRLKDAFSDPIENNVNNVNKLSFNYTPECYSNSARGAFPIINVGAHVWLFFHAGDPLTPVIFAVAHGAQDWSSIFQAGSAFNSFDSSVDRVDEGLDYPGVYENKKITNKSDYDINIETYRNKYVINQKGGTLAFINSDKREALKLTHYSGSFLEFNNHATISLASSNDQKLVLNDQFLTVRGDKNTFVKRDFDTVVQGDSYKKIGNLKADLHKQWKAIVQEIADVKQLFDIRRAEKLDSDLLKLTSSLQSRSGDFAECPVCSTSKNNYFSMNNSFNDGFKNVVKSTIADSAGDQIYATGFDGPSVKYAGQLGQPEFSAPLKSLNRSVDGSSYSGGRGKVMGITCPACGGSGKSPSSQDGKWATESRKKNLSDMYKSRQSNLLDLEKKMGIGGSEIIEITKHKIETIGLTMNDFGSIRVDSKGKMYISEVLVGKYGPIFNRTPTPLVELVHVDDLPGGNYTLNVCNRYNVLVGAGGLNLKSYGVVNISGSITNIAGAQVNIASENEVNIDGGKRLSLVGDVVSIRQRDRKQVVIDGSLGVTNNVTIAGGLHVEGEITGHHITIPTEIQATEQAKIFAAASTSPANTNGKIIGFGVPMSNYAIPVNGTHYKENAPSFTGPPYMGFTDATQVCGRVVTNTIIGFIDIGQVLSPSSPMVPCGQGCYPGPNTRYIPVYASASGTRGGPDVPVFGSGLGGSNRLASGPNRGSIKGADTGTGGALAAKMPIIVYGTGRDEDSITVYPHSHLFKGIASTQVDSNAQVRDIVGGAHNSAALNSNPPVNAKK